MAFHSLPGFSHCQLSVQLLVCLTGLRASYRCSGDTHVSCPCRSEVFAPWAICSSSVWLGASGPLRVTPRPCYSRSVTDFLLCSASSFWNIQDKNHLSISEMTAQATGFTKMITTRLLYHYYKFSQAIVFQLIRYYHVNHLLYYQETLKWCYCYQKSMVFISRFTICWRFILFLTFNFIITLDLPAMQETQVWFLGQEDPLKKEIATHSSILAWRIPWTEEPGSL